MKAAVCYCSRHHGNTRKVLEAMADEGGLDLIDVTTRQAVRLGSPVDAEVLYGYAVVQAGGHPKQHTARVGGLGKEAVHRVPKGLL